MLSVIVTILIYSLILTIVTLYKDSSGYYRADDIDIVTAGPVCWVLVLILVLLKPFFKNRKKKEKQYKPRSSKYVEKTVKRIVTIYKKHLRGDETDLVDFSRYRGDYDFSDAYGWDVLMIKKARYEFINKRFERLMWYQKEETVKELKRYFDEVRDDKHYHIYIIKK